MSQLSIDFSQPNPWRDAVYEKRLTVQVIMAHREQFREDFIAWLQENWHVWSAFRGEANKIWRSGRRHYSARTIGEYLRHESALREAPNERGFKVNDHWWPYLARLYMLMNPERHEFFERRIGPLTVCPTPARSDESAGP